MDDISEEQRTGARQQDEDEHDWDVTPDGLYVATRGFLARRGYCCANRCRNCPYINWRENPDWQPVAHHYVRRVHVSPKAILGAQTMLQVHQKQLQACEVSQEQDASQRCAWHRKMIEHYEFLLQQWGA